MSPRDDRARGAPDAPPLVSCIIIFHNEQKYLREAIESVIAQTYSEWELLLVDDGSFDQSEAIARASCDARPEQVRYLTHPGLENRGRSASRNLGLQHAQGQLVAFLDGDDVWLEDKLERQVGLFAEHPEAVMVCGATLYWHSWRADPVAADRMVPTGGSVDPGVELASQLRQEHLYPTAALLKPLYPIGRGATPSASGFMVRREAALAVGGFEESFRGLFDDQVFRAKMYLAGPIYVSTACFDRYRQHEESCCHVTRAAKQSEALRHAFLRWLQGYLNEAGYRDPAVRLRLWLLLLRIERPRLYGMLGIAGRPLRAIWRAFR